LGLAVVWNTIKDHHGHIDVHSGATGTTFVLYLPLCDQPGDESEAQPGLERGRGECILVVDDEETQLKVTTELLAYLGYRAVPVSDGRAALDAIRERHDIALVILDMIMPRGWSGLRTFEEIQRERSGIPTLIVSGYAETADIAAIEQQSGATFLPKPFTMADLGLAVQQALHPPSGS
jgi:CheY-like chemotaxis protein